MSPGGRPSSQLEGGGLRISATTVYERRDQLYDRSSRITDPLDETVDIWQFLLDARYAIDDRWSVGLSTRYLDVRQRLRAVGSRSSASGLGDTRLSAHWLAWKSDAGPETDLEGETALLGEPRWWLQLDLGVIAPTGDPRPPGMTSGGTPDSALQTGTGTWIPTFGARLQAELGDLAVFLRGEMLVPLYANRFDFEPGAYQRLDLGLIARPDEDVTCVLQVELEHSTRDRVQGQRVAVGGGTRVLLSPSFAWMPHENVSVFLGARVPVWRSFDTRVLDAGVQVQAGVSIDW